MTSFFFHLSRKKRKGVAQTKDFDHGPSMMNGNGVLYEDLAHARPRPPIAPPSIEVRKKCLKERLS